LPETQLSALACQPLALHPLIPIFHIIGSVTVNTSLPGGLEFEHINDANGIFKWRVAHFSSMLPKPLGSRCEYRPRALEAAAVAGSP
jgi:hypothetical protein